MADFGTKTGVAGTPIANVYDATPALTDRVPITGGRETAIQDIIGLELLADTGAMTSVSGLNAVDARTVRSMAEFASDLATDDTAMDTLFTQMQNREVEAPVETTATDVAHYQIIDTSGVAAKITPAISMDAMLAAPGVPEKIWELVNPSGTVPKLLSPDEMTGITTAATKVILSDTHWGSIGTGWSFADSAIQSVGMSLMSAIDTIEVLKFRLLWTTTTGNQGKVQWLIEARARATGELLEQVAVVDEILAAAPGSAYQIVASTFTMGMAVTTAKFAGLVVRRDPLFNNDDLSGAAILLGVELLAGDENTPVNAYPAAPYRFEAVEAKVPSWIRNNATVPSSGNARTLLCYAGAGPRYVYRKAKDGEFSMSKGTRWETLTGAAYVDQDTVNIAGSNVTAVGNTTHLGLSCNYLTWPAATHNYVSSYCSDGHGVVIAVGQVFLFRVELALSRALVGDEVVNLLVTGATQTADRQFAAGDNLAAGTFHPVAINENLIDGVTAGSVTLYYYIEGTFSTPLTIYVRRRMLFDASGLAASECVPDFVDPSVDYGFGAVGVKWLDTTCGNTVGANGVIIPGDGAALPEPMGVQWQPAATGLATYSPPSTASGTISHGNISVASASAAVAGLPATRLTASGGNLEHFVTLTAATTGTRRTVRAVVKKPSTIGARIGLVHRNNTFISYALVSADWTTIDVASDTSSKIETKTMTPLGNDTFLVEIRVITSSESGQYDRLHIVNAAGSAIFDSATGEYLDVAAFDVVDQAYAGTPMLASGSATSRLADDPATGLPAIGTGPFTAFVEFTANVGPLIGQYPVLFATTENALTPCSIYLYSGGPTIFGAHGGSDVGSGGLTIGTRQRAVLKREASGRVALFTNGALRAQRVDALTSLGLPKFGASAASYLGDIMVHSNRLYYTALSDAECIAMTTL